jgi:microcystin-dependent protein
LAIGSSDGEQNHSLTATENGTHAHGDNGHNHGFPLDLVLTNTTATDGPWLIAPNGSQYPGGLSVQFNSGGTLTGFASLSAAGSGAGHNNMQPYLVGNWLVHI